MQVEVRDELDSTGESDFDFNGLYSEREHVGPFRSVEHGSDSLAVSLDASYVQLALAKHLQAGWFDWLQPRVLVDKTRHAEANVARQNHERARLASLLIAAFEAEPVEVGMDHSAQG